MAMARVVLARPSWDEVPDNILVRVAAFLPCRADRIHMACVNKHWRAAARGQGRPPRLGPVPPLPRQLPWLIIPNTERPTFYSAIERRTHPLPLPPIVRFARCCGSADGGWLVLALDARHGYALYSLDSDELIGLPNYIAASRGRTFPLVVRAATLSATPDTEGYMVAAIVVVARRICGAVWWEGNACWYWCGAIHRAQDVIFHKGAFHFVSSDETVAMYWPAQVTDNEGVSRVILTTGDYLMQPREDYAEDLAFVQGHGRMRRYLVESRGELLMVVRYVYDEGGTEVIRVFVLDIPSEAEDGEPPLPPWAHVHELDGRNPHGTWVDVEELDGRALLLGHGCSRSLEVADFGGRLEPSTIYFLDDDLAPDPARTLPDNNWRRRWYSFTDMGRYSMEEMASDPWPPGHHRPETSDRAPPTWWLH